MVPGRVQGGVRGGVQGAGWGAGAGWDLSVAGLPQRCREEVEGSVDVDLIPCSLSGEETRWRPQA